MQSFVAKDFDDAYFKINLGLLQTDNPFIVNGVKNQIKNPLCVEIKSLKCTLDLFKLGYSQSGRKIKMLHQKYLGGAEESFVTFKENIKTCWNTKTQCKDLIFTFPSNKVHRQTPVPNCLLNIVYSDNLGRVYITWRVTEFVTRVGADFIFLSDLLSELEKLDGIKFYLVFLNGYQWMETISGVLEMQGIKEQDINFRAKETRRLYLMYRDKFFLEDSPDDKWRNVQVIQRNYKIFRSERR